MRKIGITLIMAALLLAAVFGINWIARGQAGENAGGEQILTQETQGDNLREVTAPAGSEASQPNISFIDSPSTVCYQPDPAVDSCNINWYYMSVDANPNYMIAMTVTLNSIGNVARVAGFFQTSMYVPYNMLGDGFAVACGPLGAGGNPQLGNAYAWTIRARDSSNLKSANYGTVYCPAYEP